MKKTILASLAVAAMLASCSKESTMDVAITSTKSPIQFTAYAGSAVTKGNPIDTNKEFQGGDECGGTFKVSAYLDEDGATTTTEAPSKYFNFSTVTYTKGNSPDPNAWVNTQKMYWPNYDATLYFGAYYPADAKFTPQVNLGYKVDAGASDGDANAHSLKFSYHVKPYTNSGGTDDDQYDVSNQKDIMYAIAEHKYTKPAGGTNDEVDKDTSVNLHFKHALTQVAFTATKDADIAVTVSDIQLCNINTAGIFTATTVTSDTYDDNGSIDNTLEDGHVDMSKAGSWTSQTDHGHYKVAMVNDTDVVVESATEAKNLTDPDDALMLIPQTLTEWSAATSKTNDAGSYLAITCKITHTPENSETLAEIFDGVLFVPFGTDGIDYGANSATNEDPSTDNTWAPGYKITYNLHFGGGYYDPTDPETPTIPEPGKTPETEDVLPTLRPITYTTSIDAWETLGGSIDKEF